MALSFNFISSLRVGNSEVLLPAFCCKFVRRVEKKTGQDYNEDIEFMQGKI